MNSDTNPKKIIWNTDAADDVVPKKTQTSKTILSATDLGENSSRKNTVIHKIDKAEILTMSTQAADNRVKNPIASNDIEDSLKDVRAEIDAALNRGEILDKPSKDSLDTTLDLDDSFSVDGDAKENLAGIAKELEFSPETPETPETPEILNEADIAQQTHESL
jgi:50S ribosomal subunit-associated GTPase HflX